ncbi:MAG TPA: hypothetical protein VIG24_17980 [Acidimicrobiia bacterium]
MSVTLWTTVFGTYHRFVDGWLAAAREAGADRLLIVSDRPLDVDADVVVAQPSGEYLYPSLLNVACENMDGWTWRMDVDDRILPGVVRMLEGRDCDVLQVGLRGTRGAVSIPQVVPNEQMLALRCNPYRAGSAFTIDVWRRAGGFPDIAHCDWGFWRRCARIGARFQASGEVAYIYREEPEDSLMGLYADPAYNEQAMAE